MKLKWESEKFSYPAEKKDGTWQLHDKPAQVGEYIRAEVSHGVKDYKGREVGNLIVICTADLDHSGDGPPKLGVSLAMYSARNGEKYGAIPSRTFYPTKEAALADVEKKLAAIKRRIERTAAKFDGVYLTGKQARAYE